MENGTRMRIGAELAIPTLVLFHIRIQKQSFLIIFYIQDDYIFRIEEPICLK
jgi:hypothetical protein